VEIYSAIPLTRPLRPVSNNGEGLYYCRHLGDVSQIPCRSGAFAEAEVSNRHKESALEHFLLASHPVPQHFCRGTAKDSASGWTQVQRENAASGL